MSLSTRRYMEIRRMAIGCREYLKTRDPIKMLKEFDVPCSTITLEGDLKGFTIINSNYEPWVYINDKYSRYSRKIIAAHELGHVLFHRFDEINMFNDEDYPEKEYEANVFLMELMPQEQPRGIDYLELSPEQLKKYIYSILR